MERSELLGLLFKNVPIYFIAGADDSFEAVKDSELADLVSDLTPADWNSCARTVVDSGPGSSRGLLLAFPTNDGGNPDGFGFYPDRQVWAESPGGVWCGVAHNADFGPKDLERKRCVEVETDRVLMADGSVWDCPVLRDPSFVKDGVRVWRQDRIDTSLPVTHFQTRDPESGEWFYMFEVTEKYRELFEESREQFDWLVGYFIAGKVPDWNYSSIHEYALSVLGLRYRYNAVTHNTVKGRFLTTDQLGSVVEVSCGWRIAANVMSKKKESPAYRE